MTNIPTDESFIAEVRQLQEYHSQQKEKYSQILELLLVGEIVTHKIKEDITLTPNHIAKDGKRKWVRRNGGETFGTRLKQLLTDNKARGTGEIRIEFNKMFGVKLTARSISSQLRALRNKGVINSQYFPNNPKATQNIWGLPDWFVNGIIKPQYRDISQDVA
ncbi:MAG: hypothetical protein HQK96_03730 [Nitrospirae bacterium]|nr:hypothetical protein [Nitrospirota bacterium]